LRPGFDPVLSGGAPQPDFVGPDTDHKGQYQYILFKNKVSNPKHKNKRKQCWNSFQIFSRIQHLNFGQCKVGV
jgi:hypothetical protein